MLTRARAKLSAHRYKGTKRGPTIHPNSRVLRILRMNEKKTIPDSPYSRRHFLKTATMGLATVGIAVWLAGLEACTNDTSTNPGDAGRTGQKVALTLPNGPALQSIGGFIRRSFSNNNGGKAVLVVRLASSGTDASKTMSTICTHEG